MNRTHKSEIKLEVKNKDGYWVEFYFDLECDFYFQPEEKEVRYYPNGGGYPGCAAEIEIYDIKCVDTYCPEPFGNILNSYRDEIYDKLENNIWNEYYDKQD